MSDPVPIPFPRVLVEKIHRNRRGGGDGAVARSLLPEVDRVSRRAIAPSTRRKPVRAVRLGSGLGYRLAVRRRGLTPWSRCRGWESSGTLKVRPPASIKIQGEVRGDPGKRSLCLVRSNFTLEGRICRNLFSIITSRRYSRRPRGLRGLREKTSNWSCAWPSLTRWNGRLTRFCRKAIWKKTWDSTRLQ